MFCGVMIELQRKEMYRVWAKGREKSCRKNGSRPSKGRIRKFVVNRNKKINLFQKLAYFRCTNTEVVLQKDDFRKLLIL
jgi:hypothetical protein